jgi:putative oxidoreductase
MPPKSSRLYVPAVAGLYESLWDIAWLLLRLAAGLCLMPHGAQKLFGVLGGGGLVGTAAFFDKIGYSPGSVWAPVVGTAEFVAGFLVAIGLFTRAASAVLIIQFIFVLLYTLPRGFFPSELAILWLALFFFFFVRGGGPLSVDERLGKEF